MKRSIFLYLFLISSLVYSQEKTTFSSMDVFELEWAQNPQISPNGTQVVYQRRGMDIMNDRRQSRLWIMNANGSNHSKLTTIDRNESNPTSVSYTHLTLPTKA